MTALLMNGFTSTMNASLSKIHRIKKRKDFLRIQRNGVRVYGQFATLIAKHISSQSEGRLGLTVSKAVGKAHVRNLIKRRLRHLVRENRQMFADYDLVVIAHPSIVKASFEALKKDLLKTHAILRDKFFSKVKKTEKQV